MTTTQNIGTKDPTTEVIHPYGGKRRVSVTFTGTGRAKQSFKAECDINNILKKYQKTGALMHLAKHGAQYGDATAVSFTEAMQIVTDAQTMFEDLPSSLRTRFANDPAQFMDFVQTPGNEDEMRELGLLPLKSEQSLETTPATVAAPAAPASASETAPAQPVPPEGG